MWPQVVVNMSFGFGGIFPDIDDLIDATAKQFPNLVFVANAGNEQMA
jgi:hypothetical protein